MLLESAKNTLYQQEMLLESAKNTLYQQDMLVHIKYKYMHSHPFYCRVLISAV